MDNIKIAVMAGTTEGRLLAEYLDRNQIEAYIFVATEYGEKMLPDFKYCKVKTGRCDKDKLLHFFKEHEIAKVYDATHPYATEVTRNCKEACRELQIAYSRVLRETVSAEAYLPDNQFFRFDNIQQAADFLKNTQGAILVTTGSKQTDAFTQIPAYQERIVLRILPDNEQKLLLIQKGFQEKNILMGQGPFSVEQNLEAMKQFGIKYVVMKESGTTGGFVEKLKAVWQTDAFAVLIKRPQETGVSLKMAMEEIKGANIWQRKLS